MSGPGGRERVDVAEKRRQAIQWFASRCDWLQDDAPIPRELAEGLVAASAWWLSPQGPLEAPGDAEHVEQGPYGWRVYTSNSFEISRFIRRARPLIREAYEAAARGRTIRKRHLLIAIAAEGVYCVSNHVDDLYPIYGKHDWIPSGNHAIATMQAAAFLLDQARYFQALAYKPRRRRQETTQQEQAPTEQKSATQKPAQAEPASTKKARKKRKGSKGQTQPELTQEQRQWVGERLKELSLQFGGLGQYERSELKQLLKALAPLRLADDLGPEQTQRRALLEGAVVVYVQGMKAKRENPPPEPPPPPPASTPTRERRTRQRRRGVAKQASPHAAAPRQGRGPRAAGASSDAPRPKSKRRGRGGRRGRQPS